MSGPRPLLFFETVILRAGSSADSISFVSDSPSQIQNQSIEPQENLKMVFQCDSPAGSKDIGFFRITWTQGLFNRIAVPRDCITSIIPKGE
jgi:hypothetical protein